MKKYLSIFVFLMLLAGCGSKPIPDWTNAAFNQLESYKKSYLMGQASIAELHFTRAVEEIKKSGNLDIMARAYLIKYALQTVLLEKIDASKYVYIETLHPSPANKTYYAFLNGNFDRVEPQLLPEQYRTFFKTYRTENPAAAVDEIQKMEDPLSRMIAIGLMVQLRKSDERCLEIAIDTASQNGWKQALLVYLDKLHSFYETRKDLEQAANIRKKIELIKD